MECHEEEEFDPDWVCCLLEGIPDTCGDALPLDAAIPWPPLHLESLPSSKSPSVCTQDSCECLDGLHESSRKRVRAGSSAAASSKACREKMRRDRVNERFLELGAVLDPGKTPKIDKAAILTDALRMVNMLQEETTRLKGQKVELKNKINELKAEKNELRAEKHKLRADKEDIERKVKALGAPPGFQVHAPAMPASYAVPYQVVGGKPVSFVNYPGVSMWQFVPKTAVDTSQDHVLRPPVA